MKKGIYIVLTLALAAVSAGTVWCQESTEPVVSVKVSTESAASVQKSTGPEVSVQEQTFRFAPVPDGTVVNHTYIIANKGVAPLTIHKVKTG